MIEKILMDLDGTLLDFNKGEKNAFIDTLKVCANYMPSDDECIKFSEINEYYFQQYANGKMDRKTFHFNRFDEIYKYLSINADVIKSNDYYVNSLKYQANLYDDALDAIKYLSKKYELYISSNGMYEVQMKRIEEIKEYFKGFYISERVGANKPNKEFFEYILRDLNEYDRNKYIIIGDRLDSDILGGINSNIKTIYVNRNNINDENIKPDYEINNLDNIKNIL